MGNGIAVAVRRRWVAGEEGRNPNPRNGIRFGLEMEKDELERCFVLVLVLLGSFNSLVEVGMAGEGHWVPHELSFIVKILDVT